MQANICLLARLRLAVHFFIVFYPPFPKELNQLLQRNRDNLVKYLSLPSVPGASRLEQALPWTVLVCHTLTPLTLCSPAGTL